jgi:hypothetical protein
LRPNSRGKERQSDQECSNGCFVLHL